MSEARSAQPPAELRQMTLGEFETALRKAPPEKRVRLDFGEVPKGETQMFDCYAAHPEELAIGHRAGMNDDRMTCADVVMMRTDDANGCTFIDQQGGEHTMGEDTPLWIANWRERTGNAVVSVEETEECILIRTWTIE